MAVSPSPNPSAEAILRSHNKKTEATRWVYLSNLTIDTKLSPLIPRMIWSTALGAMTAIPAMHTQPRCGAYSIYSAPNLGKAYVTYGMFDWWKLLFAVVYFRCSTVHFCTYLFVFICVFSVIRSTERFRRIPTSKLIISCSQDYDDQFKKVYKQRRISYFQRAKFWNHYV